ncbi:uncharacterized protein LOC131174044 [Hevea brasiliensis]|uniref:uncharacterized protein LOC131174044 n=1 Tax=Hevea brasiliensis TaxID=3981 RepID=UPI0025D44A50|nr:uncharacterized protein LOC131174044 [Hevea brasiliensis]
MSVDRSWMYKRLDVNGFLNPEFEVGVEYFLNFAYAQVDVASNDKIRCPCSKCKNKKYLQRIDVTYHLYKFGFVGAYTQWDAHGEGFTSEFNSLPTSSTSIDDMTQPTDTNNYRSMVMEAMNFDEDMAGVRNCFMGLEQEEPNPNASSFYGLLHDANAPLWEGCNNHTRLSAVSQLLNCMSDFHISHNCFDNLLSIIKSMLPEGNLLPSNFYNTKKMMSTLGLGYQKIDVCVNNCMLYYKENIDGTSCKTCGHPRYKPRKSSTARQKNLPFKVLRYLPLIPRLQRLFMSSKTAAHMVWHAFNQHTDGTMSHPVDSEAWKHFDRTYPLFASDPRNVRLGLCTDGFNPFGQRSNPYSCWPVIIAVYNLPPWMAMKKPYMFLNMVIPGPKSPGKSLDVFLRPLIDELKMLWTEGVLTHDIHTKQNFHMKAALLWTVSDFPAYGMLSGWSTHGKLACPYCMEGSKAFVLQHGGKASFFDCHRQFLPLNHPYRRQKDKFKKGVIERSPPPPRLSGDVIQNRVNSLPDIVFGTTSGKQTIPGFGVHHNWVKRSIFWELPYWNSNLIRHNLDVMHIEKNVFDNVFYTVMDVNGKTKDNSKAREDLKVYCKRPELHLVQYNGRVCKPKATYTLNKEQKQIICQWLKDLRLPDGYASNIARAVSVEDCKFLD